MEDVLFTARPDAAAAQPVERLDAPARPRAPADRGGAASRTAAPRRGGAPGQGQGQTAKKKHEASLVSAANARKSEKDNASNTVAVDLRSPCERGRPRGIT